jgi:hypothetical protein
MKNKEKMPRRKLGPTKLLKFKQSLGDPCTLCGVLTDSKFGKTKIVELAKVSMKSQLLRLFIALMVKVSYSPPVHVCQGEIKSGNYLEFTSC